MIINGEERQVNWKRRRRRREKELKKNFGQLHMNISHLRLIQN